MRLALPFLTKAISSQDKIATLPEAYIITLTDAERDAVYRIAKSLPLRKDIATVHDEIFFTAIRNAAHSLPNRLLKLVEEFKVGSNEYGTLVLRNLPIDEQLPPTPTDGMHPLDKTTCITEYVLYMVASVLGHTLGYIDEKDGALVHQVTPIKEHATRQENSGSIFFENHVENTAHPFLPSFLLLSGLRQDHKKTALTGTASLKRALALGHVSKSQLELLRKPLFRTSFPSSFTGRPQPLESDYSPSVPVITGDDRRPQLRLDFTYTQAVKGEAAASEALESLKRALREVRVGTQICSGDLFIVSNRDAMHFRTGFVPRWDEEEQKNNRWLQRMYVFTNSEYERSAIARTGACRLIDPIDKIKSSAGEDFRKLYT